MEERVHITTPFNSTVEKLIAVAGGDPFLTIEAVRFVSRSVVRTERHGFLWLKQRLVLHEEADLEQVTHWIGYKMRQRNAA